MLNEKEIFEGAKKFANEMIKEFYNRTNINVKIEFVEDIHKKKLELAKSYEERESIISEKEFDKNTNATLIFPKFITDIQLILISKNVIVNTINPNQLVSTIPHELAHVEDFYRFSVFNKVGNLNDAMKCIGYRGFYFWTEYNSKRQGYDFYRKKLNWDNSSDNAVEEIKNREFIWHLNELKGDLQKYKSKSKLFIYCVIQFIGRFSVWNDLFPNYFNVTTLPKELLIMFDSRIVNLYNFLYENKTFEDIKYKFNELDDLLSKLYPN